MKHFNLTILLVTLLTMTGVKVFAYDIAVANEDGVTIYYNYTNNSTTLQVTYKSTSKPNNRDDTGYSSTIRMNIPETVTYAGRTRKVTSIEERAFYGCTALTSIEIPNSVTSIGSLAFYNCSGLQKVIVSDIAAWCRVSFSTTNSHISNPLYYAHHLYSDENTEIKDLVIPEGVTSIGKYAFLGCSGLTSVTIPNSITSIGGAAFEGCNDLQKVIISDIAAWCKIIHGIHDNPLYYAKHLYSDANTEITDLVIPEGVTSIGNYAFECCSGLTSIEIPNSVTSIGSDAFYGCSGLTSVTIGNSVTNIGEYAFSSCSGLTSVTIPNSVTSIGESAFSGCSGLTSIEIGNSVRSIEFHAFYLCRSLRKVIVRDIAAWCNISFGYGNANPLYYAQHLYSDEDTEITELVIPEDITSIGRITFSGCSGLTSITIPNSVTSIGQFAFDFTPNNLLEITSYIEEPTSQTGSSFSEDIYNNATLYIPEGTLSKYQAAEGWKKFVWIEEGIPSGISSIYNSQLSIDDEDKVVYDLNGRQQSSLQKGINIIKKSDGTTKKVVVK